MSDIEEDMDIEVDVETTYTITMKLNAGQVAGMVRAINRANELLPSPLLSLETLEGRLKEVYEHAFNGRRL